METAFFWIIWGIISIWTLKRFYYSFSHKKLENLRRSAVGLNIAILVLTFLPWLPPSLSGKNGIMLALDGNVSALLFLILLLISSVLFLLKDGVVLKFAAVATIVNTFILFFCMYQLRPQTFTLSLYDAAPIIAVLLLLVNDVVVLLLWQQLQLKNKGKSWRKRK